MLVDILGRGQLTCQLVNVDNLPRDYRPLRVDQVAAVLSHRREDAR